MESVALWAPWITLALIIAVPAESLADAFWARRQPEISAPNPWTVFYAVVFGASYLLTNAFHAAWWLLEEPQAYGLAIRLYTLSGWLLAAGYLGLHTYCVLTNKSLPRHDLQAKVLLVILLIAEVFEPLQYVGCKLWYDPFGDRDLFIREVWGISIDRFACGRALGVLHPYIAPIVYSLYAIWIVRARRGNARIPRS